MRCLPEFFSSFVFSFFMLATTRRFGLINKTTFSRAAYTSCAASTSQPLHPDRPIGYISLVQQQIPYDVGLALQDFLVDRRHQINRNARDARDTDSENLVLFLQHPPTYTAGRRIRGKTEREQEEKLRKLGADYYEVC